MIERYLSNKLRLISFFSTLLVVFLHSYNLGNDTKIFDSNYAIGAVFFTQYFISQCVARIAVPIFFCISGYLFYIKNDMTFDVYINCLKKRFATLVVPYMFWSLLGFLLFLLLQVLPHTKMFFKKKHFSDYSIYEILDTIFINPVPFQFWFIRDLIIFVIISPLIYLIVKYLKIFGLVLLLFAWYLQFNFVIFSNESIFFFVFGAFFGINKLNFESRLFYKYALILLLVWFFFIFSETTLMFNYFKNISVLCFIHKTGILIGVSAIWCFYDFVFKNLECSILKIDKVVSLSFFIYAAHEPFLEFMKVLFYKILGKSQISLLLIYFTSPILIIVVTVISGIYIKKKWTNLFAIMTGGR